MSLSSQGPSTPAVLPYLISSISDTTTNEGHTPIRNRLKAASGLCWRSRSEKPKGSFAFWEGFYGILQKKQTSLNAAHEPTLSPVNILTSQTTC